MCVSLASRCELPKRPAVALPLYDVSDAVSDAHLVAMETRWRCRLVHLSFSNKRYIRDARI